MRAASHCPLLPSFMDHIASAELLAVGTELLLGETVDTNSAYLADSLAGRGVDVYWSQRVGDNLARVSHGIEQALSRSDLLVVCGGLGPTGDDLTREAIAQVLGETPSVDPALERTLREHFTARGRTMPQSNLKQAWLVPSARPLANPLGTAPGWLVHTRRPQGERIIVALPGPPRELVRMWEEEALPLLPMPRASLHRLTFRTTGLGESTIAELLGDLTTASNPTVATYARSDGVHVRLAAKARSAEEARELAKPVEEQIVERLGAAIWGMDDDELPRVVVDALDRSGMTIAIFEEASSGALLQAISAVPRGKAVCRGGMVAWAPQTMAALGLPRPAAPGMETPDFAAGVAAAVRHTFAAHVGVAVLEGGPSDAGRQGQATDEVVVAVQAGSENAALHLVLPPLPAAWRGERIVTLALHLLRSRLS